jgi:glycerophosphoryl diester phosphodiesterase
MKIFAHRGYSGKYPENTLLAFEQALHTGCDGIELDVHLTKDDQLVIMHDETIDRTTDGSGWIKDMTLSELREYDASYRFVGKYGVQRIPTLEEYLELVKDAPIVTNLEIKNNVVDYPNLEYKTLAMIDRFGMRQKVLFSSFHHPAMIRCKQLAPEIPAGLLYDVPVTDGGLEAVQGGFEAVHPDVRTLDLQLVEALHAQGLQIRTWTVNHTEQMQQMLLWGVDAVFTNEPKKMMQLAAEQAAK